MRGAALAPLLLLAMSSAVLAEGLQARRAAATGLVMSNAASGAYGPAGAPRPPSATAGQEAPAGLDGLIRQAAARHGLAPELVRAVVEVESAFDPRAVSGAGARGLMQLMPETARTLGVRDVYDPGQNLEAGSRHLRGLLDDFEGDLRLALAAYNAGREAVRRHGGVPPYRETRNYVRKVMVRLGGATPWAAPAVSPVRAYRDASGGLVLTNRPSLERSGPSRLAARP